jgi:hypothetical protein
MQCGRGWKWAGGVLIAALLGVVALANATTKTDSSTITGSETLTAKCPRGERVDVGGFRSTVNQASGIVVEDLTFRRQRIWKARFDQLGSPAKATAIAYCKDTARLIRRTKTKTEPLPPPRAKRGIGPDGGVLAVTAKCPRGTTVQLGGFEVRDSLAPPIRGGAPHGFYPAAMKATSAREWRVRGLALPGTRVTAVAGCSDLPAPNAREKTVPIEGGATASSATATCPEGKRVVMGGFEQTVYNGGGPYVRALERPTPRTWKVTTWEFDDPGTVTAIAYCG